jgi:hypothetical protein
MDLIEKTIRQLNGEFNRWRVVLSRKVNKIRKKFREEAADKPSKPQYEASGLSLATGNMVFPYPGELLRCSVGLSNIRFS